jgi:transposase
MSRDELTDEQWKRLEPLLPPQKPRTGRPAQDHRHILSGILWIHRTGAPWRDLPSEYGPWQTVATRFYRWVKAGVWDRILATLQQQGDAAGKLDWSQHYVDGTVVRAHQHAAGARHAKGGSNSKRSDVAKAASAPRSTSVPKAEASHSPSD